MKLRYLGGKIVDFSTISMMALLRSRRLYAFLTVIAVLLFVVGPYKEVHALSVFAQVAFWPGAVVSSVITYLALIRACRWAGWRSAHEPILVAFLVPPVTVFSVYYAGWTAGLPIPPITRFLTLMAKNYPMIVALTHMFAYFVLIHIEADIKRDDQETKSHPPSDARPDPEPETESYPVFLWGGTSVPFSEILRLEADRQYVRIHTARRQIYVRGRFSEAIALLPPKAGIRIHRSHWVRNDQIGHLVRAGSRIAVVIKSGETLPISRSKLSKVRRLL